MMQFFQDMAQPIEGPPREILSSHPQRAARPAAAWLLVGLVLFCLLPRALMAFKSDIICRDGVLFVQLGSALERGDLAKGLGPMWINIYPLILMGLHRCGLDWGLAGTIWGVAMGSLTVLPLYGWIRRQFNDRVGLVAAILYAVHPKFIEWTPELTRDQTFWFLAALTLYLSYRAITEVRLDWFCATGLAVTLAVHTRFEGWFLFLPILLWSGWRLLSLTEQRLRLSFGLACCLLTCPLLIGVVNHTWLRNFPERRWGDFHRLAYVQHWFDSLVGRDPSPAKPQPVPSPEAVPSPTAVAALAPAAPVTSTTAEGVPPASSESAAVPPTQPSSVTEPIGTQQAFSIYFRTLLRGLNWIYWLFMLLGWWLWRDVWLRRESQPLFYAAVCVMTGMWIHLFESHMSSSRYPLTLVILSVPYAAFGVISYCQGLTRMLQRLPRTRIVFAHVFAGVISLITIIGWTDALTSRETSRVREAALGKWLLAEYGPDRRMAVTGQINLITYYSGCAATELPLEETLPLMLDRLAAAHPELLLVSSKQLAPEAQQWLMQHVEQMGLQPIPNDRLPSICRKAGFVILVGPELKAALPRPELRGL
jgi:4-amino-4-deoxy-L-arabinose transferase-like glycosyltransferase